VMCSMALLAVLPLLAARPARRAQSAEVSWTPSWDDQIQNCLKSAATNPPSQDPTVTHARVTKFLQNAFSSVEVALSGENGWNPDFVWITNAEGTVIALQSSPGTGNTGLTWTAPATGNSEPPSQLNVHTCPPLLNSTGIDSWRGRYEAAVAYCCAELDPTPAQKQTFGISLRVNWLAQTITASASQQAVVLNYVRNEAGTVMGVAGPGWDQDGPTDALTMSDFGDGSTTSLLIPPLSQSLVACALNSELTKEICTTVDLVSPSTCTAEGACTAGGSGLSRTNDGLIANLERGNSNPGTFTVSHTTTGITGTPPLRELLSATATFTYAGVAQNGRHCVLYARTGTTSGDVLGFMATDAFRGNADCEAQGKRPGCASVAQTDEVSLTIELPTDAIANPNVVIHGCCGVEVNPRSDPPVTCPNLKATTFAVATLRAEAKQATNLATLSAGTGLLSDPLGAQCDYKGVAILPGEGYNDPEANSNCTCTVKNDCTPPATACFVCEKYPGFDRFLTKPQAALFAIVGLFAGCGLIGILIYVMRKPRKEVYRNTMVEIPQPGGRA